MPEIKAIKTKTLGDTFDFNFFADNRGKHESLQKVAIGKLVDDELLFKF